MYCTRVSAYFTPVTGTNGSVSLHDIVIALLSL